MVIKGVTISAPLLRGEVLGVSVEYEGKAHVSFRKFDYVIKDVDKPSAEFNRDMDLVDERTEISISHGAAQFLRKQVLEVVVASAPESRLIPLLLMLRRRGLF